MHLVWLALGYVATAVAINLGLYGWRRRMLQQAAAANLLEPLGLLSACWAFLIECTALGAVVLLIPFGWLWPPWPLQGAGRGAVVLLHGWGTNRGAMWLLRSRLLRAGWGPVCCFEAHTLSLDIEGAAARLRTLLDRVASTSITPAPLIVVGFGIGGLVLRYYLRRYPAPRVRRVVTLGTPHRGTAVARALGPFARALVPRSAFLRRLNAGDRLPEQFDVVALHSTFDATVLPLECALYPGAFNAQFSEIGHFSLLFSAKVFRVLRENLAAPLA